MNNQNQLLNIKTILLILSGCSSVKVVDTRKGENVNTTAKEYAKAIAKSLKSK